MNFRTNLSRTVLMANDIIKVYFEDKVVFIKSPSLRLYLNDLDFIEYLYILKKDSEDFNDTFLKNDMFKASSKYEMFQILDIVGYKKDLFNNYINSILINCSISNNKLFVDENEITSKEFDILFKIILITCAEEKLDDFINKENKVVKEERKLSNLEKKILEQEERLKKLKQKSSNKSDSNITIDQIVIGVLYEFPSLSLEKIYEMNMFTLLEFWKYVSKVVDTQIQVVAAGNGLIKKFTYFIK